MTDSGGTPGGGAAAATGWFRRAVEFHRAGDSGAALERCERIVGLAPSNEALAAAHNLAAVILAGQGRLISAAHRIALALEAGPRDPRLHAHAARIQLSLGRYAAAAEAARTACRLEPESAARRYELARILRRAGALDEAESLIRDLPEKDTPLANEARILHSEILLDRGDRPRAADCLRPVVDRDPGQVRAWAMLAELDRGASIGREAETSLQRLADTAAEPADRATALFALGRLKSSRGDDAEAFQCLKQANAVRAEANPFDPEAWKDRIAAETPFAPAQPAVTESPGAGRGQTDGRALATGGEDRVFVVGMPRSGTTLCEQMLSAHPQVFGAGELTALEVIQTELRAQQAEELSVHHPVLTVEAARQAYLDSVPPQADGHARVVDKAPRNFERLALIFDLFPAARVIWMVRHPLDTVLSCFMQDFGPGQSFSNRLDDIAWVYAGHARLLRSALRRWGSAVEVVVYEDLVSRPAEAANRLAAFLGLPFDPVMAHPERNPRRAHTASSEQIREPVNTRSVGRWERFRGELDPVRERLVEDGLLEADGGSRLARYLAEDGDGRPDHSG